MIIYTLDYIQKEAESILGDWNGSDDKFIHNGEVMTEDEVNMAADLLDKLKEVGELTSALGI